MPMKSGSIAPAHSVASFCAPLACASSAKWLAASAAWPKKFMAGTYRHSFRRARQTSAKKARASRLTPRPKAVVPQEYAQLFGRARRASVAQPPRGRDDVRGLGALRAGGGPVRDAHARRGDDARVLGGVALRAAGAAPLRNCGRARYHGPKRARAR